MGLFSKNETCSICSKVEGKQKLADGIVCTNCLKLCGRFYPRDKPFKKAFKLDIQKAIECNNQNKELQKQFQSTKKIGNYIEFDDNNKFWLVPDGFNGKKVDPKILRYDEVVDFELLEDGDSVTKGGLGRAVVGGVLLGGVGAVVGGVTGKRTTKSVINNLKIKITVNDINKPSVYINLIMAPTKSNSIVYKVAYGHAQEILSALSVITQNVDSNTVSSKEVTETISVADELIKLKSLLDEGLLTQEEFVIQKNKLLNN